ncbi:GGDEF domain-containing protein [Thalassospira aquimaris]|uniref:diguanylate cyclase n=1 Tax=Thalassospira aquimaris TaxID=3037796 RepID=A0ABT6GH90_9PROT|nr:sensor domain-containing diguanylate cyclase [Thalassospira sp. FZY0004]MDG4721202.1 sensor domain-containing diguanylate cyclase [Thalassospira sp. FZY0004]
MVYKTKPSGWRRILDEQFLSVFLSIGLLLGILFLMAWQTTSERENAQQRAIDSTGFAITTYSGNLASILIKADNAALMAAREAVIVPYYDLERQLSTMIKDDNNLAGYILFDASGKVAHEFTFFEHASRNLPIEEILARHRDAWIEPAFRPSKDLGMKPGYFAVERGIWSPDGTFLGVIMVLLAIENPYEDTPLERFLAGSKMRVATLNTDNLLAEAQSSYGGETKWFTARQEDAFWNLTTGTSEIDTGGVALFGDFVMARQNLDGLPITIFMQVPVEGFMDNYYATRQTAFIAALVVIAVTLFLILQIRIDRKAKHKNELKRLELDKRLQFSLDSTGQGLWDWDFTKDAGYYSDNLYRLMELHHGEVCLTFDSFKDRIHPDDRKQFDAAITEHIKGDKPAFEVEARMHVGSEDQWNWFSHSGSVIEWDRDHAPKRMIGLVKNIHHQKLKRIDLEFKAQHDPLTGLLNRAAFEDHARRTHALTLRTDMPYCMIMLDIDHFKRVNDTYGHDCGDIVLKRICEITSRALRFEEEKLLFRLGGEEFVILLPQNNCTAGAALAERIRKNVCAEPIFAEGHLIDVTISAGVAAYRDNELPQDTLKRADWALYQAKNLGRDRIHCAPALIDVDLAQQHTLSTVAN